jgi:sec-independent protein translocase protein TatA
MAIDSGGKTIMGLDNPLHIVFLLILLLLVFGAKRLPEMGKSLGSGMRGFKDALSGDGEHTPPVAQPRDASVLATPVAVGAPVVPQPLQVAPETIAEKIPA